MFKSLFFALFWHLWLCWRASYFISDHLLLKNLLRTLSPALGIEPMTFCSTDKPTWLHQLSHPAATLVMQWLTNFSAVSHTYLTPDIQWQNVSATQIIHFYWYITRFPRVHVQDQRSWIENCGLIDPSLPGNLHYHKTTQKKPVSMPFIWENVSGESKAKQGAMAMHGRWRKSLPAGLKNGQLIFIILEVSAVPG